MKKLFFVSTVLFFVVMLQAQEAHQTIIKADVGLVHAWIASEKQLSTFGEIERPKDDFCSGLSLEYYFTNNWALSCGLTFARLGSKSEKYTGTNDVGEELGKFYLVRKLNVLEFPLLAVCKLPMQKIKSTIFLGPRFGYLITSRDYFESDYGLDLDSHDVSFLFKKWQVSAQVGASVELPLNENMAVGLSASYLHGLTNLAKDSDYNWKNRDFRLSAFLGYYL